MHQPAVAGPSGDAQVGGVLLALPGADQHLDVGADQPLVVVPADLFLQLDQPVVALLHHGLARPGPACVAAGVPGRGEYWKVKALANRARRTASRVCSKSCFGLARKADDDVGGDGRVRHRGAHPVDDVEVAGLPVGPAHRAQHRIRAGLHRHVQLRADVRGLGHRRDHVVGEVARVRAGEPDPVQPVDPAAGPQQLAEGQRVAERAAVGVDVLAEQGDLGDALGDQGLDLGQHVAGPAVGLLAAQARARCRTCSCCRSPPRSTPRPRRPSHDGWAGRRGSSRGRRGSRPGPRRCAGPVPAAPAGWPGCGCRRPRRPRAPSASTAAWSFCARQPPTAICMPGRADLIGARWLRLPYSRLSAFSRTAQVLNTTRSASRPLWSAARR